MNLTTQQVLEMEGGSELDALIHIHVLKDKEKDVYYYLADKVRRVNLSWVTLYSQDPTDDYELLAYVRKEWEFDNPRIFCFTDTLVKMWQCRAYNGTRFERAIYDKRAEPNAFLCRMYEPGDYSRAALVTVLTIPR